MKKRIIIAAILLSLCFQLSGSCFANAERNMLVNSIKLDSVPTTYLIWTPLSNDLSNEYFYNLADEKGNVILERYVDEFYGFNGNVAKISKNGLYNFIKRDGTFLTDQFYDDLKPFSEGYARFKKDNKWGYIDENGTVSIEAVYEQAYSFRQGMALIKQGTLYGFINTQGEYLYIPQFHDVSFFRDDMYQVWIAQNSENNPITPFAYKCGLISKNGEMILDPIYDWISSNEGNLIVSELGDSMVFYKLNDNRLERISIWEALIYDPVFVLRP